MVLAFKKHFVDGILTNTKIHTIREDKHDRWKTGKKIHFATGVRTKHYQQFMQGICKSTQSIEIKRLNGWIEDTEVKIDGRILSKMEVRDLAWNDGFANINEFCMWFKDGFKGKLIHWTDKRY